MHFGVEFAFVSKILDSNYGHFDRGSKKTGQIEKLKRKLEVCQNLFSESALNLALAEQDNEFMKRYTEFFEHDANKLSLRVQEIIREHSLPDEVKKEINLLFQFQKDYIQTLSYTGETISQNVTTHLINYCFKHEIKFNASKILLDTVLDKIKDLDTTHGSDAHLHAYIQQIHSESKDILAIDSDRIYLNIKKAPLRYGNGRFIEMIFNELLNNANYYAGRNGRGIIITSKSSESTDSLHFFNRGCKFRKDFDPFALGTKGMVSRGSGYGSYRSKFIANGMGINLIYKYRDFSPSHLRINNKFDISVAIKNEKTPDLNSSRKKLVIRCNTPGIPPLAFEAIFLFKSNNQNSITVTMEIESTSHSLGVSKIKAAQPKSIEKKLFDTKLHGRCIAIVNPEGENIDIEWDLSKFIGQELVSDVLNIETAPDKETKCLLESDDEKNASVYRPDFFGSSHFDKWKVTVSGDRVVFYLRDWAGPEFVLEFPKKEFQSV